MTKNTNNPFDKTFTSLKAEEKAFMKASQNGDFESVDKNTLENIKVQLQKATEKLVNYDKEKPLYLRTNEGDILNIKAQAKEAGMPYQTYLKFYIHKLGQGKVKIEG